MRRGTDQERGAALLLALVVTAIMSALLSGILLLSVSHLQLTNTDNNYANALNVAEAGINWELWKLTPGHGMPDATPVTVTLPSDSTHTYTVHFEADPAGDPKTRYIVSTGTVDGVPRTVRVRAEAVGIFGRYALFGTNSLDVGGSAQINGATGTNGVADINGNPDFNGNFWYCGPGATGDTPTDVSGDVLYSPLPEDYPTVNEVATQWAQEHYGATGPQTVEFFKTHNNNAALVDSAGTPVKLTNYALDLHAFKGTTGTIVLNPGDYYFESLDLPSNNTIQINASAALGTVNIWIGPDGGLGKPDTINGKMLFASTESKWFNLYDGANRALKMNGTMDFYGNFLVYNGPARNGSYYGTVEILGTGQITGSVIGYDVYRTTGNATISFPSTGGGSDGPTDHWAVKSWEEVNPL